MYLLDTNVVSELRKVKRGKADQNVHKWSLSIDPMMVYVSSITIHEIELGVLLAERSDKVKGRVLRQWMDKYVLPVFENRVISVDKHVALQSAKFHVPNPKPYRDTLIGATALVHNMTVVTRNTSDFNLPGVITLNPWEFIT